MKRTNLCVFLLSAGLISSAAFAVEMTSAMHDNRATFTTRVGASKRAYPDGATCCSDEIVVPDAATEMFNLEMKVPQTEEVVPILGFRSSGHDDMGFSFIQGYAGGRYVPKFASIGPVQAYASGALSYGEIRILEWSDRGFSASVPAAGVMASAGTTIAVASNWAADLNVSLEQVWGDTRADFRVRQATATAGVEYRM